MKYQKCKNCGLLKSQIERYDATDCVHSFELEKIKSEDIAIFSNPLPESRKVDDFLAEKINEIIDYLTPTKK